MEKRNSRYSLIGRSECPSFYQSKVHASSKKAQQIRKHELSQNGRSPSPIDRVWQTQDQVLPRNECNERLSNHHATKKKKWILQVEHLYWPDWWGAATGWVSVIENWLALSIGWGDDEVLEWDFKEVEMTYFLIKGHLHANRMKSCSRLDLENSESYFRIIYML